MPNDLSALISTRICHDLINPLGAISNGMELLSAIAGQSGPEIDLVSESAERATAKLNFFRIAFGNAENQSAIKGGALQSIIHQMFAVGRFKVVWPENIDSIPRGDGKLLLLLLLAAESSAPLGGQCTVKTQDSFELSLSGPRITPNAIEWDMATGKTTAEVTASTVHFAAIEDTLRTLQKKLMWSQSNDTLELKVI